MLDFHFYRVCYSALYLGILDTFFSVIFHVAMVFCGKLDWHICLARNLWGHLILFLHKSCVLWNLCIEFALHEIIHQLYVGHFWLFIWYSGWEFFTSAKPFANVLLSCCFFVNLSEIYDCFSYDIYRQKKSCMTW